MRWNRMARNAEKNLRQSRAAIEHGRLGVPSGRTNDWRVGRSPSSHKEKR